MKYETLYYKDCSSAWEHWEDILALLIFNCHHNFFRNIPDVAPVPSDQKPSVSKSGRKIRGRGTIVRMLELSSFTLLA